mmetsp:Transcript_17530/g.27653  ORF Transcript_17530/g.27653 Transcript_17530/m.27653 type:complete len:291 (-) Transcript_17530:95-967(-)
MLLLVLRQAGDRGLHLAQECRVHGRQVLAHHQRVQGGHAAEGGAQAAVRGAVRARSLVHEAHQRLQVPVRGVVLGLVAGAAAEPLERGVARHAEGLRHLLVPRLRAVELGDHHVLVAGVSFRKPLVNGGELLAVAAPRGVKFHKDVLGLIVSNLVEVQIGQDHHVRGRLFHRSPQPGALVDPGDDAVRLAGPREVLRVRRALRKPLQGGKACDAESAAKHLVLVRIHLGDDNVVALKECVPNNIKLRSQVFAVSAPGGIELYQHIHGSIHNIIEVFRCEFDHFSQHILDH